MITETKHYDDGTSATGAAPLPDQSPGGAKEFKEGKLHGLDAALAATRCTCGGEDGLIHEPTCAFVMSMHVRILRSNAVTRAADQERLANDLMLERDAALVALKRYGHHDALCDVNIPSPRMRCTCGFAETTR